MRSQRRNPCRSALCMVLLAAVLFRMPVYELSLHAACGQTTGSFSADRYLKDAGNLRFCQSALLEGQNRKLPVIRRVFFRVFQPAQIARQPRMTQRMAVSKPKFLVPPSRRLIVGRYTRANPVSGV